MKRIAAFFSFFFWEKVRNLRFREKHQHLSRLSRRIQICSWTYTHPVSIHSLIMSLFTLQCLIQGSGAKKRHPCVSVLFETSRISVIRSTVADINKSISYLAICKTAYVKQKKKEVKTEPDRGLNEPSLAACECNKWGEWKLLLASHFQRTCRCTHMLAFIAPCRAVGVLPNVFRLTDLQCAWMALFPPRRSIINITCK